MKKTKTVKKTRKKNNLPLMLFCLLLGGGLVYGSLSLHFVKTRKEFIVCPKTVLAWQDTFADTSSWGPIQYAKHPRLTMALLRRKKVFDKDHIKDMERKFKKNSKEFEKTLEKELDNLGDLFNSK